jgi:membrane fusion protein, multidrug efflux system
MLCHAAVGNSRPLWAVPSENITKRRLTSAAIAAATLLVATCDRKTESAPPAVKFVIAEAARLASDGDIRVYPAVVKARIEAVQAFRVGGRIVARHVDVGDVVAGGQVLAKLDASDWALNLESLRGQLAAATAQRDNAKADLARFRELTAQKLMSSAELDRQQHAAAAADGQVAALAAQVQEAVNKLDYTSLKSDADGIVTKVVAEPGQVISEGAPVLIIARTAELEVEFSVPEQSRRDIEPAQRVNVSLWSQPDALLEARIREIASEADPVTRAFRVRATLLHAPAVAKLGMTATVRLGRASLPNPPISLPIAAVFEHEGGKVVWEIDAKAGTLRLTSVTVGGVEGNRYIVTSGVLPGDLVVTAGVHRLTASDHVALYDGGEQTTRLGAER